MTKHTLTGKQLALIIGLIVFATAGTAAWLAVWLPVIF